MDKKVILGNPTNVHLDEYDIDGLTVNQFIAKLTEIAASNDGDKLKFSWDQHDKWDARFSLELKEERLETDDEYHSRIAHEKIEKSRAEDYERTLYNKLRKKYE